MPRKVKYNWDEIEPDYREGIKSLRELSRLYGPNEASIRAHARKHGWIRDLNKKLRNQVQQSVMDAEVLDKVARHREPTDKERIKASAEIRTNLILSHRKDIKKHRTLLNKLYEELKQFTMSSKKLRDIITALSSGDSDSKATARLLKQATTLSNRVTTAKQMSDILKTVVALEREAFDIDKLQEDNSETARTLRDVLKDIDGNTRGLPQGNSISRAESPEDISLPSNPRTIQ